VGMNLILFNKNWLDCCWRGRIIAQHSCQWICN